jgi:hypothetical protein
LAPLERRPLLLVAAAAVAGVPALHCKASPLPFSLLACSCRLLLSPSGEISVAGGEGESRMDGWFAEGACVFIAEVVALVTFRDGNWERAFFILSTGSQNKVVLAR